MPDHRVGTTEEWRAARLELLEAEKALTRRGDEVARQRQQLPWVRVDKQYGFDTEAGPVALADLFDGRSQLLVYHFMLGPDYQAGCPSCSAIADGFDGFVVHLANHGVTLCAVSRAPLAKIKAYKRRMGWSFPWVSSFDTDFNFDFQAAMTEEQQQSGAVEYNSAPWTCDRTRTLMTGPTPPPWARTGRHIPGSGPARAPSRSTTASSTTPTPPTPGDSTGCGVPTSGSTGHRWGEMRADTGGDDTTSTERDDGVSS